MKRWIMLLLTMLTIGFYSLSMAEPHAYEAIKFKAELATGKPILVAVHAPWCSTCRAQASVLKELLGQQPFQAVTLVHVDFDSQPEALKQLGVKKQSTLIVFKHGKEVARSLGDTSSFGIESLLQKII